MSWLTAPLRTSVGKKCVMGLTGLFLCLFLLIHLAGNFLLFAGAESYNAYAHALHANKAFLLFAEVFLYGAFFAHIYLAITTHRENSDARGSAYAYKQTKRTDRTLNVFGWTPDTTMFVTGSVVLAFLLLHLNDFSWNLIGARHEEEPYEKAVRLMGSSARGVAYLIGCVFLGVHVAHGFQSAFQSLGVNHPALRPIIRKAAIVFAFVVTIGFGSFVLWGWSKAASTTSAEAAQAVESTDAAIAPDGGQAAPDAPNE